MISVIYVPRTWKQNLPPASTHPYWQLAAFHKGIVLLKEGALQSCLDVLLLPYKVKPHNGGSWIVGATTEKNEMKNVEKFWMLKVRANVWEVFGNYIV